MEKKRKSSTKKSPLKKKAIAHFKDDIRYYKKEADEDRKNIAAIKKSKKIPKKRLERHLKGDMKGFKEEIKEDRELCSKLKGKKNGSTKSYKSAKSKRKAHR